MHEEVAAALHTLLKLVTPNSLTIEQRDKFLEALKRLMFEKFKSHWNLENPIQGNGYRSITICDNCIDPLIVEAATYAKISGISDLLPRELYLWVDPFEVSYRLGERTPIKTVYLKKSGKEFSYAPQSPPHYQTVSPGQSPLSSPNHPSHPHSHSHSRTSQMSHSFIPQKLSFEVTVN